MHALPGAAKVLTILLPSPPCVHTTTGPRLRNTRERALFTPSQSLPVHHLSLIMHHAISLYPICPRRNVCSKFFKWPVTVQDHTVIPISPGNPIPARRQGQTRPSIAANGRMRPHICERRSHHLDISCHFDVVFISAFCVVLFYASPRHRPIVTFPSFLLGYAQRVRLSWK